MEWKWKWKKRTIAYLLWRIAIYVPGIECHMCILTATLPSIQEHGNKNHRYRQAVLPSAGIVKVKQTSVRRRIGLPLSK